MSVLKIVSVQSILTEDEIDRLLEKAKTRNKKDAIRIAVNHFIECDRV
jgi:hypothetical protein